MKLKFTFLTSLLSLLALAQTAPSYYSNLNFSLSRNAMKEQLTSLITSTHNHETSYNELRQVFKNSDRDPEVYNNILLIYGSQSSGMHQRSRSYYPTGNWNREHVYPKSKGSPNLGSSGPGADAHHIRPSDIQLNSNRGNDPFIDGTGATAYSSGGGFYLGEEWRGDVARILMYMYVRYGDRTKPSRVVNSPYTWSNDMPDVLLKWNVEDPVSDFEKNRNNVVYEVQGNRNPFIDNPYLATVIWNGPVAQNTWPDSFGGSGDDTEAPTVPTNLTFLSSTTTSITFSWTASTDNIAVSGYAIYVDGQEVTIVNETNTTITGLIPHTNYNLQVVAIDTSNNRSDLSSVLVGTTLEGGSGDEATCGTEDFEGLISTGGNPPASSYTNRQWTNNGITWNATNARTDLQIENGKAITIRNGSLKSSEISGGIGMLKVKTKRQYSGGTGVYRLIINGEDKGEIPYTANAETQEIYNINMGGTITIELVAENSDRVSFDDLTWTCYSNLSIDNEGLNATDEFVVYPNPATDKSFYLKGLDENASVSIYHANGQLVQTLNHVKNNHKIVLQHLPVGLYIIVHKDQSVKVWLK